VIAILAGKGKGAEFRRSGYSTILLPLLVLRAYAAAFFRLPDLLSQRRRIRASRHIDSNEFIRLIEKHTISVRRVAWL